MDVEVEPNEFVTTETDSKLADAVRTYEKTGLDEQKAVEYLGRLQLLME